jgi:hypothetical protein
LIHPTSFFLAGVPGPRYDETKINFSPKSGGIAKAETVGFGKQKREMLSNSRLAPDVRVALINFKTPIKSGVGLIVFENREGGFDRLAAGDIYYEFDVGRAHAGDDEPRGKRRWLRS